MQWPAVSVWRLPAIVFCRAVVMASGWGAVWRAPALFGGLLIISVPLAMVTGWLAMVAGELLMVTAVVAVISGAVRSAVAPHLVHVFPYGGGEYLSVGLLLKFADTCYISESFNCGWPVGGERVEYFI